MSTTSDKVYSLLEQGKTNAQILRSVSGLSPQSLAAYKANWTMKNQPKVYEVFGSFVIEATSPEEATAMVAPRRNTSSTRLLTEPSLIATRLTNTEAETMGYTS